MDIDIGFGRVLRVRWLKADTKRRHLLRPKVETRSEKIVRWEKAVALLEHRLTMLNAGKDTTAIEKEIRSLGFAWEDVAEDTAGNRNYSYWRVR